MHRLTDSVRVVIFGIADQKRFLLVAEADEPDNWKLPGGRFNESADNTETPEVAAARELQEELGLSAGAVQLRFAAQLMNDDGVSARYIFSSTIRPDRIKLTAEIAAMSWHTTEDVPECKNKSHIRAAVAAARQHITDV